VLLCDKNVKVSLNKVARLMCKNGIHAHFSNHQKKAKTPRSNVNFASNKSKREVKGDATLF
jgi:hypothetical protein